MTASLIHNSRSPHGVLTERSLTTHDRKGREGKGSGMEGMRVETNTTSSSYVSAGARAATSPSPTTSPVDVVSAMREGRAA